MVSIVKRCIERGWAHPPGWVKENIHWEVVTGSVAYGTSNDMSDMDIYSWSLPPKVDVFPHLEGYIPGFGKPPNQFNVWQQHHIEDKEKNREYDLTVYSIVKYFQLCMENNPNMIEGGDHRTVWL